MNKKLVLSSVLISTFLLGCTANEPKPVASKFSYTKDENTKLTYCMGIADTVMSIAHLRKNNKTKQEVSDYYLNLDVWENKKLLQAMIDRTYNAEIKNAWDYTINTFRDCGVQLAGLDVKHVEPAGYCMQTVLITSTAFAFKKINAPKEEAYKKFSKFGNTEVIHGYIDSVYNASGNRGDALSSAWKKCMAPITDV